MKDLFKTKEEAEIAVSHFKTLLDHPGWKLIEQILDENIAVATEKILEGGEDITKEQMDISRRMLKFMKELRNTPSMMIRKLENPEPEEENPDPFETVSQLRKARQEAPGQAAS